MSERQVTLGDVLAGVPVAVVQPERTVSGLAYDSRQVRPGFLFFAFPGARADGRDFAAAALDAGALAVVSESPRPSDFTGEWWQVPQGRHALARAARNFYRAPDATLNLTGVTGTNGKTTTTFIIDALLRAAGRTTALIGTIEYHVGGQTRPAPNTTPESLELYRLLDELREMGGTDATMEVSSHALALGRVYGVQFHTAVFTNLTRDHLDFHGTLDDYFAAKASLFTGPGAQPPRWAILNADDPYSRRIPVHAAQQVLWYGLHSGAELTIADLRSDLDGLHGTLEYAGQTAPLASPLVGRINAYNLLAACGVALSYGFTLSAAARLLSQFRAVPGRFERVDEGQPFLVVVDYAHTDDALRNVLAAARGLGPRQLITLFGCGGDRDRAKRPLMGQAAGEASDYVVLTSDNPRSEEPLEIMMDALVGLRHSATPFGMEVDRATAIRHAIERAQPGDIVILAGKGHETYQILRDKTIPFDDRVVARQALRQLGYGSQPE